MHCSEDPCECGVKGDSSEETRLYEAAGIHHADPVTPPTAHRYIYYGCCLDGKTRAAGEPTSVTDETPARDSAGLCGPVD